MERLCLNCGNQLDENDYCPLCDIEVSIYKKAENTSKLLYNQGLQMAKVRDLSGAINILQRSIKFDKRNIQARNLLGLIYFEIGETVLALKQWVISKNLAQKGNIAEEYLTIIQDNQQHLDKLNAAIKKFNQALTHIKQGSVDLATIQLKKVIALNPRFIKAYCLLALCYMKENQEAKAEKILKKVLSIDKSNYVGRKYYDELHNIEAETSDLKDETLKSGESALKKFPMRIPDYSLYALFSLVAGVVIGLSVALFLIMPGKLNTKALEVDEANQKLVTVSEELMSVKDSLSTQTARAEAAEAEAAAFSEEIDAMKAFEAEVQKLLEASSLYYAGELFQAADELLYVNSEALTGTAYSAVYEGLSAIVYEQAAREAYDEGYRLYKSYANYPDAIIQFDLSYKYAKDLDISIRALYYKGWAHRKQDEKDKAVETFKLIVENYTDYSSTFYYEDAIWLADNP